MVQVTLPGCELPVELGARTTEILSGRVSRDQILSVSIDVLKLQFGVSSQFSLGFFGGLLQDFSIFFQDSDSTPHATAVVAFTSDDEALLHMILGVETHQQDWHHQWQHAYNYTRMGQTQGTEQSTKVVFWYSFVEVPT